MTPREPWKPRILSRFGRVLATILALFYVVILIGDSIAEGLHRPNAETAAVVAVFSYSAVSAVAALLTDRVGGAMLVVAGVALACLVALTAGRNHAIAAVVIGGPFLLAGAALLLAAALRDQWRYEREETLHSSGPEP
jgi:hypothetical protein